MSASTGCPALSAIRVLRLIRSRRMRPHKSPNFLSFVAVFEESISPRDLCIGRYCMWIALISVGVVALICAIAYFMYCSCHQSKLPEFPKEGQDSNGYTFEGTHEFSFSYYCTVFALSFKSLKSNYLEHPCMKLNAEETYYLYPFTRGCVTACMLSIVSWEVCTHKRSP